MDEPQNQLSESGYLTLMKTSQKRIDELNLSHGTDAAPLPVWNQEVCASLISQL